MWRLVDDQMSFISDFQDFPFYSKDKGVWYFIIDWKNKTKIQFCTVGEKRDLILKLSELEKAKLDVNFQLFGVWNGKYSTDIFELPISVSLEKLKAELK